MKTYKADPAGDYVRPPRPNKRAVVVTVAVSVAVSVAVAVAMFAGFSAAAVDYAVQKDRVKAEALADYGIVLDDKQAGLILTDGSYALVKDGTDVALITLAEGTDSGSEHIELDVYVPVVDVHGH